MRYLVIFITLVSLVGSTDCQAIELLDQSNVVQPGGSFSSLVSEEDLRAGQVVTVGMAGKLSRIDLGLFREHDLPESVFIDVAKVVNGIPDFTTGGRLATTEVASNQLPFILSFPAAATPKYTISLDFFASDLEFSVGDRFAIVMRAPTNGYHWWTSHEEPNTYLGGDIFQLSTFNNLLIHYTDSGAHFRTYMAVEVPEPSAFMACLIGLLGLPLLRARANSTFCAKSNGC